VRLPMNLLPQVTSRCTSLDDLAYFRLCSLKIARQRSTHSSQMATSRSATMPRTSSRALPQNEQQTLPAARSSPEPMRWLVNDFHPRDDALTSRSVRRHLV
jgi:hypothetical protein